MNKITFKGFLLQQDLIALQESLRQDLVSLQESLRQNLVALQEFDWSTINKPEQPSNDSSQKIDIDTQISNLKKFIGKRTEIIKKAEDTIKRYQTQVGNLEIQSDQFPSDKQKNDEIILNVYRNIGLLRNQISKATKENEMATKEIEKINDAEAKRQGNIGWSPKDDKHARAVAADIFGKPLPKFGVIGPETGDKPEVITAADPRWMDYDGNQRGGKKPIVNPPPIPGTKNKPYEKPWFTGRSW